MEIKQVPLRKYVHNACKEASNCYVNSFITAEK